jgi:TonB-dependent SusC/RagA subfamily outer membrane receptor
MIVALVVYGTLVGALVVAAASAAEPVARLARVGARGIWLAAMLLTLTLVAIAPLRRAAPVNRDAVTTAAAPVAATVTAADRDGLWARVTHESTRWLDTATASVVDAARRVPRALDRAAAFGWLAATLVMLLLFAAVQRRVRRASRDWPAARVHHVEVRVAAAAGPMVIGVLRPEVVVPRWLLGCLAGEQRLMAEHEAEHVRARDPLLLAGAWFATALAPWNPALWFMLSRVRLAVELDCDARVLRRGARAADYGALLLDVAARGDSFGGGVLALAGRHSHLQRRLIAMKTHVTRFGLARAGVAGALGVLALAAACEAHMPTAADVDQATAATAERAVKRTDNGAMAYLVDGRVVTAQQAHALPADSIGSIAMVKGPDGTTWEMRITKRNADTLATRSRSAADVARARQPLFYINGVLRDSTALHALARDSIASVEVIKGKAAAAIYGAAGLYGVIVITTKGAAASK